MVIRRLTIFLILMLLFAATPAAAQRDLLNGSPGTDILTGQPLHPPVPNPRSSPPQSYNPPPPPREIPPMEIYVAPQYGTNDSGYQSRTGVTGQYGTPQVVQPNSLSDYRERQVQAPQYGNALPSPSRQFQRR